MPVKVVSKKRIKIPRSRIYLKLGSGLMGKPPVPSLMIVGEI